MFKKLSKNEKVFIAGANGMVGKSIRKKFLEYNFSSKNNFEILDPPRKELNLEDYNKVSNWFKKNKPSIVIISAAKVGGIYANKNMPYDFLLRNLKIQNNIIEILFKYSVKRLLFLGSSCIYPKYAEQPINEESLLTGTLESTNEYYALAKISGIKLCEALIKQHSFDAICLMPTNLYGPGDNYNINNSHVLPAFIRKFSEGKEKKFEKVTCWGTGKPLREFLFVDDLANAVIFALENWYPQEKNSNNFFEKIYWLNVGSEDEISIKDLAFKISKIIGYEGKILWDKEKPDGTPRKKLNTKRINMLGWYPKTSLDEGLKITIEDYQKSLLNNSLRL